METVASLIKIETLGQEWSGLCAGVNICNELPRSLPVTCNALGITHPCSSADGLIAQGKDVKAGRYWD